jgi:carnosine N-methyltransferase
MSADEDEDTAEMLHFNEIAHTFVGYSGDALRALRLRRNQFSLLSGDDRGLLAGYAEHLDAIERGIGANATALAEIASGSNMFGERTGTRPVARVSEENWSKLRSTIRQFVRDWSVDGALERQQCYQPLIDALLRVKPASSAGGDLVRVLVPGCGLSRLAFEIARLGYSVTGNEFSYHMLIASNWVLNCARERECCTLHPYLHHALNHRSRADMLRAVRVPDVCPAEYVDLLSSTGFSMAAGDFVELFGDSEQRGQWDAVVTCFFVDTAHNIVEYVRVIFAALKPGGVWLNLGPLLYHFAETRGEASIELELDELLRVVERVGFELMAPLEWRQCTYASDARSMLQSVYDCAFFQCRKPAAPVQLTPLGL